MTRKWNTGDLCWYTGRMGNLPAVFLGYYIEPTVQLRLESDSSIIYTHRNNVKRRYLSALHQAVAEALENDA